jgi:hypothetical protein
VKLVYIHGFVNILLPFVYVDFRLPNVAGASGRLRALNLLVLNSRSLLTSQGSEGTVPEQIGIQPRYKQVEGRLFILEYGRTSCEFDNNMTRKGFVFHYIT